MGLSRRKLGLLVATIGIASCWWVRAATAQPAAVADDATLAEAGVRKLTSRHLTLYTDLPSQPGVDELPQVFDLAVPAWARFFEFDPRELESWHVVGCVMRDRQRFVDYGLLPEDLPPFLNGYQAGDRVWVLDQPSDYYRRHLLLHEGTHAVMYRHFGDIGPAWYREGMAELIGTHQFRDGKLVLGYFPRNKTEVEHWGRIKLVLDNVRQGKPLSILKIMDFRSRDFLDVESYAWCWALAAFCHRHPRLETPFRALQNELGGPTDNVNLSFLMSLNQQGKETDVAWQLFLHHLDYGYDVPAEAVRYCDKRELPEAGAHIEVDARQAWQSSGLSVSAGQRLLVEASGRYQVGQEPRPWWCEPQGVTIEYYQDRPLGMLLGAIDDPEVAGSRSPLTTPLAIGRRLEFTCERSGVLFLRINERADGLRDNQGSLTARISLVPAESAAVSLP